MPDSLDTAVERLHGLIVSARHENPGTSTDPYGDLLAQQQQGGVEGQKPEFVAVEYRLWQRWCAARTSRTCGSQPE